MPTEHGGDTGLERTSQRALPTGEALTGGTIAESATVGRTIGVEKGTLAAKTWGGQEASNCDARNLGLQFGCHLCVFLWISQVTVVPESRAAKPACSLARLTREGEQVASISYAS